MASRYPVRKKIRIYQPWAFSIIIKLLGKRQPNFVASKAIETYSSIWLRLPKLPTEYYDHKILAKIVNKIDRLVKIDVCTSATLRGRYARICVEVPVEKAVRSHIHMGNLK
ncbi:hypothetical protein R3W88_012178 [Solanum pinnatisectum]|uniref:DUF4283 domain-containing protein n=1 Tax=Solanum pinnatisectum TaxID=50273 RepID=A0AAV9L862_9SOLN|nr:hypothetical protein R3W88_012178 [Solanum pinnatisectum]